MFRMLIHPSSGACDLFVELFHGLYFSGSMCVGVTLWFGCGGVVSVCRLKQCLNLYTDTTPPQPNHNVFNTFTTLIYMFRALLCSSSGGQIVLVQYPVSSLSLGDCSVHRSREFSRSLCTEQSPKESDDTRCCTNTI